MNNERKYDSEEVREIFDLAVGPDDTARIAEPDEAGLTLAQIQDVGREVGMDPTRIAEAALMVSGRHAVQPRGTRFGVPISVGRNVDLPRDLTDREWAVIVGELRETFRAKGRVTAAGGIREWTNGNLHAFVEPTAEGYRLRMGSRKGNTIARMTVGTAGVVGGLALIVLFLGEQLGRAAFPLPTLMTLAGMLMVGSTVLSQPRWAREREEQMAYIAGRVQALIGQPPDDGEGPEPRIESGTGPEE